MGNTLNNRVLLSEGTDVERIILYKKTYAHVAGGALLFMFFEYYLLNNQTIVDFMMSMTQGYKWLLILGGFMFITKYAESTALKFTDKNLQYAAYAGYIFVEALIFVPLLYLLFCLLLY